MRAPVPLTPLLHVAAKMKSLYRVAISHSERKTNIYMTAKIRNAFQYSFFFVRRSIRSDFRISTLQTASLRRKSRQIGEMRMYIAYRKDIRYIRQIQHRMRVNEWTIDKNRYQADRISMSGLTSRSRNLRGKMYSNIDDYTFK